MKNKQKDRKLPYTVERRTKSTECEISQGIYWLPRESCPQTTSLIWVFTSQKTLTHDISKVTVERIKGSYKDFLIEFSNTYQRKALSFFSLSLTYSHTHPVKRKEIHLNEMMSRELS